MTSIQPLVIDLAVKGTLLLVLAFGAAALLRRSSAAARHLHWQLALAGLLALPLLAAVTPRVAVPAGPLAALLDSAPPAAAAAPRDRVRPTPTSLAALDEARDRRRDEAETPPAPSTPAPAESPAPARASQQPAATPRSPVFTLHLLDSPRALLLVLWGAGAAAVLGTLLLGLLRARALARRATPITDPAWLALADRVRSELSLQRLLQLRRSPDAIVPLTFGWRRPVVLLPADSDHWSPSRRRHVLLHELAHVRRADWPGQMVAQAACALYWWQPLAWLASRELRRHRELACDDAVLRAGSRASEYADHLLAIAASRSAGGVTGVATLAMARRSQLEGRLLAVLEAGRRRAVPGPRRALAAAGLAAALVTALACVQPEAEPPAQPRSPDAPHLVAHVTDAAGNPVPDAVVEIDGQVVPVEAAPEAPRMRRPQLAPPPAEAPLAPEPPRTADAPDAPDAPAPPAQSLSLSFPKISSPRLLRFAPRIEPMTLEMPDLQLHLGNLRGLGYMNVCDGDCTSIWSWSHDDDHWTVTQKGDVEPDDSGTHIGWIDDEGSFSIVHEHGGVTDHLEAKGVEDEDGNESVAWSGNVGGQEVTGDAARAEADKLMAVALTETGVFASSRVSHLVDQGGTQAALDAIRAMSAGSGRESMLHCLLTEHELDTSEFADALALATDSGGGDAELAEVLQCIGPDAMGDPDLVEPLFHAVESIESDAEEAEVLECLLGSDGAEAPVVARGLQAAAAGIESDACAAEVLQTVSATRLRDASVRQAWVAVLETIDSDASMAEVLQDVMGERAVKGETAVVLLTLATQHLDSDAYMAEVLQALPARTRNDPAVRDALFAALATIESDAYAAEVANSWLGDGARPDFTAALLPAAAHQVDSDAYLAEVLEQVPDDQLHEPAVRAAFEAALGSIQSKAYQEEARERLGEEN
ncbi:MAG TPA: M56 family metallopeptidase [Planctomycetota bacterium]|nr:M56 family metallopeptidase [Planctomycetota bacterium]